MANLFTRGAIMLNRIAAANLSTSVIYKRGAKQCSWNATFGYGDYEAQVDGTTFDSWASSDFMGATAELVAGGITLPPVAGDQVICAAAGQTVTYELRNQPNGQAYDYCDVDELRVRVYNIEISRT